MGRKHNRHKSQHDSDEEEGNQVDQESKIQYKDLDFAQRRELQRQQAAQKRKAKQRCYLCGQTGHVRRECPGIADDGRGMSRYKGKSDPTTEKQNYQARKQQQQQQHHRSEFESTLAADLDYPEAFEKKNELVYYDVHCDIVGTIEYLRSGRGKAKISQKEAIQEYQTAMGLATEQTCMGGILAKSFLKPNRPWISPIDFSLGDNLHICFVVGLTAAWKCGEESEQEGAIRSLVDTVNDQDKVIGIWCVLDYSPTTLATKGMDEENQLRRLECGWEAAGMTGVPLQIQVLPGAAGLDPEQSVAGTDYAKVLLALQTQLGLATTKYPSLAVHLVGWSGRADHTLTMLNAFPSNLKAVGLDGSVSFTKAAHLHECAFEIPLDRLVLETSNVIPSKVANTMGRTAYFQSGWWPFVAESVAHYKKTVPVEEVAAAASRNSIRLYPQLESGSGGENAVNDDAKAPTSV